MIRISTLLALGLVAVGPTTLLAQQTTPPPTAAQVDTIRAPSPSQRSVNDIKSVQLWLKELKLYDRAITGEMNPDTHAALRAFEKMKGLPVTGEISDRVMTMLRAGSQLPPCEW